MGSRISRRRRRTMDGENNRAADEGEDDSRPAEGTGGGSGSGSGSGNSAVASVLSFLIRSGQVRIYGAESLFDENDEDEDEEEDYEYYVNDNMVKPRRVPSANTNPDTKNIDASDLKQTMLLQCGSSTSGRYTIKAQCCGGGSSRLSSLPSVSRLLQKREYGLLGRECFTSAECCFVASKYLPNHMETVAKYQGKAFCGTYSTDGNIFLSACQDRKLRIYDTTRGQFRVIKRVVARDVGWSVLDTAFSPDGNYLIYSSWSDSIHICNIYGEDEAHNALPMQPDTDHSFCIFSVQFSADNSEIVAGANDGCIYVYDREKGERILKIDAHEDDVNAVTYADDTSHIIFSGGDDGLCKVWDRRTLREDEPHPVGVLAGHSDGITFIDTKGDGRYLISNCKDQTIKLWDVRKLSNERAQTATKKEVARQHWDYRWQQVPSKILKHKKPLAGDTSLMTYVGHCVLNTLVRCRFSPAASTAQRYIYCGCATGAVVIYDVLTGCVVNKLHAHKACVRDISWHPYDNTIMSTSWDGSLGRWEYHTTYDSDDEGRMDQESDDEFPDSRRSASLQERLRRRSRPRPNRLGTRMVFLD